MNLKQKQTKPDDGIAQDPSKYFKCEILSHSKRYIYNYKMNSWILKFLKGQTKNFEIFEKDPKIAGLEKMGKV